MRQIRENPGIMTLLHCYQWMGLNLCLLCIVSIFEFGSVKFDLKVDRAHLGAYKSFNTSCMVKYTRHCGIQTIACQVMDCHCLSRAMHPHHCCITCTPACKGNRECDIAGQKFRILLPRISSFQFLRYCCRKISFCLSFASSPWLSHPLQSPVL